jgi:23S rRNA A2030 N6-methylase RlmJ
MEVSYTLVDTQSGKTVWSKNIASEHTAKAGEAFAGVKRLRLANEGAAKANIEQVINEISAIGI